MSAKFKFAIVLNALFGLLGWYILLKHPTAGLTIIILNWIIFFALMKRRKPKQIRIVRQPDRQPFTPSFDN